MNQKLEIRETNKFGRGVYAKNNIKKGELLSVFGGYVLTSREIDDLPEELQDEGVTVGEDFILSSKKKSEVEDASYFNHSCDPNAGFHGQIFLVAMRNIKRDEEITFDYGMVLFHAKRIKPYKLKCLCGKELCRKFITDNDWKKKELQKKYNGYFQYFLQEKINKIKIR